MSDIVERLRNYIPGEHEEFVPEVNALAIAEIERLRAPVGKPIAEAPRDGTEQAFEVKFSARAFWDEESKRWVLSYPLNLEYLPSHSRYLGPARINGAVGGSGKP